MDEFTADPCPALAHRDAQPAVAVNEQLAASVKKANEQAEYFEREWYLRGDQIEALKAVNEQLLEAVKLLQGIVSQFARHNEKVCRAIAQAEYEIEQAAEAAKGGV